MTNQLDGNKITKDHIEITGSGGMWDDFKFGRPGIYAAYDNDFVSFVADEWTVTEVEGAGTVTQTLLDSANGVLQLTSGTNENDGCQLQLGGTSDGETTGESFAPVANKKLYFETRIKANDVTQMDIFMGLHVQDTTIIAGKGSDFIGFRTDDGDASLDVESSNSSSVSDEAAVATLVDDTFVNLGFKVNGTDSIEFWVDGSNVQTITSDIPTALMKLSMCMLTGDASANTVDVDYIRVYQER